MTAQKRAQEWLKENNGYAQFAEYETADIIQQLLAAHSVMLEALDHYAECRSEGCTCGDGWDHAVAREAVEKVRKG